MKTTLYKHKEFGQVRTFIIDNEPWFVGKDILSTSATEFIKAEKAMKEFDEAYSKLKQNNTLIDIRNNFLEKKT